MISKLLGWGPWRVVQDVPVKEQREWVDHDAYGYEARQTYTWEGRQVVYKRENSRTGKIQYKYEEFRVYS